AMFLWRETHTDSPLIGLSIFTHIRFTITLSTMLLLFIAMSAGMVMTPFFLEEILRLGPGQVGLILMTPPVCTLLIAPLSGRLSDAIGDRLLTTVGLVLVITGMFLFATLGAHSRPFDVIWRLIVMGSGTAIFASPNSSAMLSAIPRKFLGIASCLQATARNLGMTAGVAVATAVFAFRRDLYQETAGPVEAFVHAFRWVIIAFAVLAVVALLVSLLRIKQPAPSRDQD
ncbi:MAG: MFS transporter, partial [candidate division Zixibacteria bacterium]|nr:MFS transporter [candidate division Zixibacteria bacterium]